jgi:hypothetical protein
MTTHEESYQLHVRLHTQQLQAIKRLALLEGRSQVSCCIFLLEVMLEVLTKQPRYPLDPEEVTSLKARKKPLRLSSGIRIELDKPFYERLKKKADEYRITIPVLIRLLWQTGLNARKRYLPSTKGPITKEVFVRVILGCLPLRPPLRSPK